MIYGEPLISRAMLAAGMQADREAWLDCLPDGERLIQVYVAMVRAALLEDAPEYMH